MTPSGIFEIPMTGVVIVTHGAHGVEMLKAAAAIVGKLPLAMAVTVAATDSPEYMDAKVRLAASEVDVGLGVLFLVDLHGSTPYHVCQGYVQSHGRAELLCGLNLAMLIKLATCERTGGPPALAELLKETGARSIVRASALRSRGGNIHE